MAERTIRPIENRIRASTLFAENLLRDQPTGHTVELLSDTWEGVGPNQRIKVSPRRYRVTTPSLRNDIEETWTVVKQSDGATIMGVGKAAHETYVPYIYKPHPAVLSWMLEFPSGGRKPEETLKQLAVREFEEETGFKAGKVDVIMQKMRFAPFRFEQSEAVVMATDLSEGTRKLDYEEKPIEVHLIPVGLLPDLLKFGVIRDFRTYAITADFLLRGE